VPTSSHTTPENGDLTLIPGRRTTAALAIIDPIDGAGTNVVNGSDLSQPGLEQTTLRVLREYVADNGSALAPFRLPQLAKQIVAEVLRVVGEEGAPARGQGFGERLGVAGLGLRSWLAVSRALTRELVAHACGPGPASGEPRDAGAALVRLHELVTDVADGLAHHEMGALLHQRDEIQAALERVVRAREDELRQVIQELSTPVMPVHAQILVVPLIGGVDEDRARRITERVLEETARRRARILIIDVTGMSTREVGAVSALTRTIRAVQLLGARAVLVGIPAELAATLAVDHADLEGLLTLANLQSGIEWGLRELGLAIQRAAPQAAADPRKFTRSDKHGS
jgi:rsbT co-antagonist protein RsbR